MFLYFRMKKCKSTEQLDNDNAQVKHHMNADRGIEHVEHKEK